MALLEPLTRRKTADRPAPAPATDLASRRRILDALEGEQREGAARAARLAELLVGARERHARARDEVKAASTALTALEGEQLATSSASERRVAEFRRQLAEGAPAELAMLRRNIAALVDRARLKVDTRLADGYQGPDGRRARLVSTNVESVDALLAEARRLDEALAAELLAEVPNLEHFGPFAEIMLPASQLQPAPRPSDAAEWVPELVVVPRGLAELFAAITGASLPRPELSPAEAREIAWAAERAARRRWNAD
jgi:hypothetical protein